MPVDVKDTDGGLGVVITGTGMVTGDEYTRALLPHLAQAPEQFAQYHYSLSDYSAVTEVEIPNSAVDEVARYCVAAATSNPEVVVAMVTNPGLPYGLARMWELLTDSLPWESMVFTEREEAEAWIRQRVRQRFGLENIGFS